VQRRFLSAEGGRNAAVAGALGLVCAVGPVVLHHSNGASAPRFQSGTAWLLSTSAGLLTKVDGGSARPVAQLSLPDTSALVRSR